MQLPLESKVMNCMFDMAKASARPPMIWPSTIMGLIRTPQSSTATNRSTSHTPVSGSISTAAR
ncbi:hypothetical protein D3C83_132930 [compost metagenome]